MASFRRRVGALLVVVGAPVLVFSRSTDATIGEAITVLAVVWFVLLVPMVRVLCLEWRNNRLMDSLRALVD